MSSLPMQLLKQAQPLLNIRTSFLNMEAFNSLKQQRGKVVFIMGATGTGKSRLAVDLATYFSAEIINSDKIQVHKGLDIVTNKVTKEEQRGVPHHLLSVVNPHVDYTAKDFCVMATQALESILHKGKLPIIVGGSNSYIETLVSNPNYGLKSKYDCCFLWLDVSTSELYHSLSLRVDQMVKLGLVNEVRELFDPNNSDYTRGIRQAIGVPELDTYFRSEDGLDEPGRMNMLQCAIDEIKENTCKLANKQLKNIYRLKYLKGWELNHFDATQVFRQRDKDVADLVWQKNVTQPSLKVVIRFLECNNNDLESDISPRVVTRSIIGKKYAPLIATT